MLSLSLLLILFPRILSNSHSLKSLQAKRYSMYMHKTVLFIAAE